MVVPVQFEPGLNYGDAANLTGKFVDGYNFLFERGNIRTRPGIVTYLNGFVTAGDYIIGAAPTVSGGNHWDYFITATPGSNAGKVFQNVAGVTPSEITGAGFIATSWYPRFAVFPGNSVLFTANSTVYASDGTNYAAVTGSPVLVRFLVAHGNRAVAAATDFTSNAVVMYWSVLGDETDWSGATSGSATLAHFEGTPTGLLTSKNLIILGTTKGFGVGFPTGTDTVYRWEKLMTNGIGPRRETLASYQDVELYFVGPDDVYSYDVFRGGLPTRIGGDIFDYLSRAGFYYTGFVVDSLYDFKTSNFITAETTVPQRPYYVLAPMMPWTGGSTKPSRPIFLYNIVEKNWTVYRDANVITTAFPLTSVLTPGMTFLGIASRDNYVYKMSKELKCEYGAKLVTSQFTIESEAQDFSIQKLLMVHEDPGDGLLRTPLISMSSSRDIGKSYDMPFRSVVGRRKWRRQWAPMGFNGNQLEIQIEVPPGQDYNFNKMFMEVQSAGEFNS